MQNKKDKKTKADMNKAAVDVGKTAASGSADAGKKGAQGRTEGKKGWKK